MVRDPTYSNTTNKLTRGVNYTGIASTGRRRWSLHVLLEIVELCPLGELLLDDVVELIEVLLIVVIVLRVMLLVAALVDDDETDSLAEQALTD
jgi:hypothetical protein